MLEFLYGVAIAWLAAGVLIHIVLLVAIFVSSKRRKSYFAAVGNANQAFPMAWPLVAAVAWLLSIIIWPHVFSEYFNDQQR